MAPASSRRSPAKGKKGIRRKERKERKEKKKRRDVTGQQLETRRKKASLRKDRLTSILIRCHSGGETNSRTSSSSGSDSERSGVENESKHLTLGRTGITDHEDVDVSSDMGTVLEVLLHSTEQQEENRLLDVVVAVNRRSEGLREEVEDVLLLGEFVDLTDVGIGDGSLGDSSSGFGRKEDDVVGEKLGAARGGSRKGKGRKGNVQLSFSSASPSKQIVRQVYSRKSPRTSTSSHTLVDSNELNPISRLTPIDHVVLQHDLDTPRKLTSGSSFGHLLDRNGLLIPEGGESVLHGNDVAVSIVPGDGNGRRAC